jgi:hypothetical protein
VLLDVSAEDLHPHLTMTRVSRLLLLFLGLTAAGCRSGAPQNLAARLDNWVVESWEPVPAVSVACADGRLDVSTHSKLNGAMIWLRRELPANFTFEYDFTPRSPTGFFLLFFCARGVEGEDVLSPEMLADRAAKTLFEKYVHGHVGCYHVSYRRGEEANCNLRKNPGLALLRQQPLARVLPAGRTVHVRLTKQGNHVVLTVGGEVFMDYTDDAPPSLGGGRLALRQVYDSEASYSNVTLRAT